MKNLLENYYELGFNNALGLTAWKRSSDPASDYHSKLCLSDNVAGWCRECLSQEPLLLCEFVERLVVLRFADEEDCTLFKLRFAHHFN